MSSNGEKLSDASKRSDATCTTKFSLSGSSAAAANSFLPISLMRLVVGRLFLVVEVFYQSFQSKKSIFAPLKVKKGMLKTTSGLILATRKVSSKNFTQLALSVIEKAATTNPKVSSMMPLIFYTSTPISLIKRLSVFVKVG